MSYAASDEELEMYTVSYIGSMRFGESSHKVKGQIKLKAKNAINAISLVGCGLESIGLEITHVAAAVDGMPPMSKLFNV